MSMRKSLWFLIIVIKLHQMKFQTQPHTLAWTTHEIELHLNIKWGTSRHDAFHFGFSAYSVEGISVKLVKYRKSNLITTLIKHLGSFSLITFLNMWCLRYILSIKRVVPLPHRFITVYSLFFTKLFGHSSLPANLTKCLFAWDQ